MIKKTKKRLCRYITFFDNSRKGPIRGLYHNFKQFLSFEINRTTVIKFTLDFGYKANKTKFLKELRCKLCNFESNNTYVYQLKCQS